MRERKPASFSRRRFLKGVAVAGVAIGGTGILAACGDATATPATTNTTSAAATTAAATTAAPATTAAGAAAAAATTASSAATTAAATTAAATGTGTSLKTKAAILDAAKKYSGSKLVLSVVGTSPPLKAVIDEWTKATGVSLETTAIPPNEIFEKLTLNFTSDAGNFDLVSVTSSNFGAFAPYLTDLTQLNTTYNFDEVQLVNMFKWYGKYNGGSYGIPYDGDQYMLFYRTDWLKKVGGDPANPPATWDDVFAIAQKMHNQDLDGNGTKAIGFAPRMSRVGTWQFFATKLASFGGDWFDENWQPAINSAAGVAALEYAAKLKSVGPANSVSIGFADLDKMFLAGQVGFIEQFSTTATKAQFDKTNSKVIDKFGVMKLPAGPGGSRQYSPGGVSLAVTKSTKQQELAYLCARYLACEETAVTQAVAGTGVEPTMVTAYNNPDFQAKWGDGKTSWKVAMDEGSGKILKQIPIPEFAALQEALDLKLSEAYSGQTKPKDALDSVANSCRLLCRRSCQIRSPEQELVRF